MSAINLGTAVFLVIIIYLMAYVIQYLGKEKLAIYEVSRSEISEEISGTGLVLRQEALVETDQKGYVNYYVKDGARVKKGGVVYSVDTTGRLQAYLNELADGKSPMTSEEKGQIFEDLQSFSDSFSDDNFQVIYEAQSEINHDLMSYTDTVLSEHREELEEKYGKNSYIEVEAEESGLISFFSDGMEKLKESTLSEEDFGNVTKMEDLRTREEVRKGTPVYRLITGQEWSLIVPVSKDDYKRMKNLQEKDVSTVQITFKKDNFVTRAPFSCFRKNGKEYIRLSFDNYVQKYMNQRYLSVNILLSETEGLQVPSSSLVEKEVYKIPADYLTKGSNSSTNNQVNVITEKKGEEVLTQVTVTVYRTEGDNVLISSEKLKNGDRLSDVEKAKTYTLKETSILQGVYVVNRGFAEFEPVTIMERTEDYCIIRTDDSKVELYDRIILNSNTIKENQVIY